MSFDDLMQRAEEIEQRAAEVEIQQMVKSVGEQGSNQIDREGIRQKYQGAAVPHFEPFTGIPDPSSYDTPIEALGNAMEQLSSGEMKDPINGGNITANPDLTRVGSAGDTLESWTGEAADNFKRNFLDPFPAVVKNQFLLLGVMRGALEADQERWRRARDDIETIAEGTLSGLDNVESCGKNELKFTFSVASAVAAVGSIPFTGGASAAGIAAVGAVGSVGAAAMDGEKVVNKEGGSADQVVQSMKSSIDELTEEIRKSGGKVAKALNGISGEVEADRSAFVSARPALAGMDGDEVTSDDGLGRTT